jgi:putative nucleotidyltransferase with HDIG domain
VAADLTDVALNPGYREQELMAGARQRPTRRLSGPERRAQAIVGGLYALLALTLLAVVPLHPAALSAPAVIVCLVAFAIASNTEFDTDSGATVPTQVAFVPLLFAVPLPLVPVAVPAVWALAKLPAVARGELRPARLVAVVHNSWFALGPVLVLALAAADAPSQAGPGVLIAAFAAQFALDFAASAVREALARGASLREQLGELWVYGIDAALTPVGLLAVWATTKTEWAAAALLPLLGVLGVFARERRRRVDSLVELNRAYQGMAVVLGEVVEHDDGYTGEHCRQVVALALAVANRLGLDAERRRNLEFAALLHDVGKVAIPKDIINKPGKLDAYEWELVKTHTVEGQRMLDRVGGFMSDVGTIVRSHHERWDGEGYPDGLAGERIPLEARIIACCDSFNAMTTDRAYRAALAPEVAAEELRICAGSQFDPVVAAAALAVVGDRDGSLGGAPRGTPPERSTRTGAPAAHPVAKRGAPA